MTARLQYGGTAKVFHWLMVALLLVQYSIGWLMPEIHQGMKPGTAMTFHISVGITILILIVVRFAWLLTPLPPRVRFRLGSVLLRKPCIGYSMRWFWLQQLPAGCSPLFAAGRSPTFFRADADAGWGQCCGGKGYRRVTSGNGIGIACRDWHPHCGGPNPHLRYRDRSCSGCSLKPILTCPLLADTVEKVSLVDD